MTPFIDDYYEPPVLKRDSVAIAKYMRENLPSHTDYSCNCVNATSLAEDAFTHFFSALEDIPESLFEQANQIAAEEEKRLNKEWEDALNEDRLTPHDEALLQAHWAEEDARQIAEHAGEMDVDPGHVDAEEWEP